MKKAFLYTLKGRVQGVGFRYFVYKKAVLMGIKGYIKNLVNGDVEVWAEGEEELLKDFEKILKKGPVLASVRDMIKKEQNLINYKDFQIIY